MKIHDGKLGEFKALAKEAADAVEADEPDMQGYNWYLDRDKRDSVRTVSEQRPHPEAPRERRADPAELLGVVDLDLDVYGKTGSEARAALDPLGAVYHDQVVGLSRF